jgi:hypothetical protein
MGATATFVSAVVGTFLQVAIFVRQGKLHDSVNGQTEAFKALIRKEAFGSGEAAGIEAERTRPAVVEPLP